MNKVEIINLIKAQNITNASVLGIFYNKVCIGKYQNNEIIFNTIGKYNFPMCSEEVNYSFCNQLRVFNKDMELRIIENNGTIFSKKIDDNFGIDFFDESMYLRDSFDKKLVVRNYLNIDKNNQVIIDDSRLVEIV